MANHLRTYRHAKTGVVGTFHPRVAEAHPDLIEVADGAKPLAYTPIPREAVESLLASRKEQSDEGLLDDEEEAGED